MCWSDEVMTARPANAGHPITPKPGTVVRESDGLPGNMFAPLDFPLLARCITCGGLVREERWFASKGWAHVPVVPQQRGLSARVPLRAGPVRRRAPRGKKGR